MRQRLPGAFFTTTLLLLGAGAAAHLAGAEAAASSLWVAATVLGLAASLTTVVRSLLLRRATVDLIAVLALAGALWVGEPFAGAVVAVMLASGQVLEARAERRARRELSLLVERAPRTARRRTGDGVEVVDVDAVVRGDRLLVGTGEVVPVDGRLLTPATLDESALTGEPLPVERPVGDDVRSGVVNAGSPAELLTTADAAGSTYAALVRLVEQAQAESAPYVRAADRLALLFVPLTLAVAGLAWLAAGDPVRAVAVLVVATPCPLLLAVPVAIMSGLSRAAQLGVVVKGGGALERLAAGRVVLFDKTGTLTRGRPELASVVTAPGLPGPDPANDVLRLAASLDQVSPHVLAHAVVAAATARGLDLTLPAGVVEEHGHGLSGTVGGHEVRVGKRAWIVGRDGPDEPDWVRRVRRRADLDGSVTVFVALDGAPVGAFLLADPVRPDAPRMVRALREAGIRRIVLVTGDRADVAESVGRLVGVDAVLADRVPQAKLDAIRAEGAEAPTIMVGDGVNDAPALAAAGVGVALAARGATASSEAADVVLTVDRVDALADAVLVARRARRIAVQAAVTGMGLSLVAMGLAAVGLLAPAVGALVQEGIDVLAIGVALRGVLPTRLHTVSMPPADVATARRLRGEHDSVLATVEQIRAVADGLSRTDPDLAPSRDLLHRLETELVPHEEDDERDLVPLVARALGGSEATAALSRTHAEITHQVGRLRRLVDDVDDHGAGAVEPDDVVELRRILYGLYAVCRLHNSQEESAFALVPTGAESPRHG